MEKPYAFFDWGDQARQEIRARGQSPVELRIEPGGAEFAAPAKQLDTRSDVMKEPDPGGRIRQDSEAFIYAETTVVPATVKPGGAVRVHVQLRPNAERKAHWNNEAGGLVFWANPEAGWRIDQPHQKLNNPPDAVSLETRTIEFEVVAPATANGAVIVPAYVLYYVCENVNGTCLYRRRNIPITINVKP